MRRTALALLVASSGCNWVFGLTPTVSANPDGGDATDAPDPIHTRLVWGVTTEVGAPTKVDFAAIGSESTRPMVPTVQVGAPLGMAALQAAPYSISDGSFEIPFNLREAPHRIVYTLPGETVAHEVQWSVSGAVLVVPRTSRINAAVVPTASGYDIAATGVGGPPSVARLTTTGVFTFEDNGAHFMFPGGSATETTYAYAMYGAPLAGPSAAPQASKGDYVILADWSATGVGNQVTVAGYAITQVDLMANGLSMPAPQPTWIGSATSRTLKTVSCGSNCIPLVSDTSLTPRINSLGPLAGTYGQRMEYGMSPSTGLPGFLPGTAPTYVPRPNILPFSTSEAFDTTIPLSDPMLAQDVSSMPILKFDRVITAGVTSARTVDGATLTSSIQTITTTFTGSMTFNAPLALTIKLGSADLSAADGVMVDPSSQAIALTWAAEQPGGTAIPADDFVVTLFEITGGNLAPVRIYQVLSPAITVDGSLLQPNHEYTFAITARKGFPNAAQGNYTAVSYPFSEATTFCAAFTVKP